MDNQKLDILRTVMDQIDLQVWYQTAPDTYGEVNQAVATFLGSDVKKIAHKNIKGIVPDEVVDEFISSSKVAFSGTQIDYETDSINQFGEKVRLKITKKPIFENNEVKLIMGVAEDITLETKMKAQLRQSQYLMNYVIEHNNSAIAVHDKDMKYLFVSQKYLEQFDVKDKHLIGKHHYELFPEIPNRWREVHKRAMQGEIITGDRDPFVRTNGKTDWTKWECRPWYEQDGSIGGIIIYTELINDQILMEKTLRERANELFLEKVQAEATLLSIGDGVITTDAKGYVTNLNMATEKLTGWSKEEALGKHFDEIFIIRNEHTGLPSENPVRKVLELRKTVELENHTMLYAKNGEVHHIEDCASPIFGQNEELIGVVLVFRDVTDKKERQKQIEYLSIHDFLTGIYNRRFFVERYEYFNKQVYLPLGVMMIDLNGLKILNDAYGHHVGDFALKEVAKTLQSLMRHAEVVARIGGDEFAILVPNASPSRLKALKEQIERQIFKIKVENIHLSLSIGYAMKEGIEDNIEEVINSAENYMYRVKLSESKSVRNKSIKAILKTLTDKYEEEKTHSKRVSQFCIKLGEHLDLSEDELKELELAGMFHDIGKISIPDAILDKPAKLTQEEFEIMKMHTENGYQILRAADEYSDLAKDALYHHERWDGLGYPSGLKGEDIPLYSRIIGLVDAYEAMTADRSYRKKLTKAQALKEIIKCAGTQFDPNLAKLFVEKVLNEKFNQTN